jgi:ribosomal-protein-alanine N-acetyltransferase
MICHLISQGKEHYKNKICLEVNCSNILALKLYSYLGFKKVGVREGYYQDGMDAILMDLCI